MKNNIYLTNEEFVMLYHLFTKERLQLSSYEPLQVLYKKIENCMKQLNKKC